MANTDQNTEQNGNKVQLGARVDPAIFAAIEKLAADDERSVSNTVERLLKSHQQVAEILKSQAAGAAA